MSRLSWTVPGYPGTRPLLVVVIWLEIMQYTYKVRSLVRKCYNLEKSRHMAEVKWLRYS